MQNNNKKYVELIWADKYDRFKLGKKMSIEKPDLPFQTIETINKPRLKNLESGLFNSDKFYPENEYPPNYPECIYEQLVLMREFPAEKRLNLCMSKLRC
ncbi:MAG: hypothetical protein JHC32_04415 [Candidatus Aminicenantes bacterium]|jgi:hypothetical protein|nr:hypothetical protein [Candidatus Aminicenantes bacterium]